MSVSGVKLLAFTELITSPVPLYRTRFYSTVIVLRPDNTVFDSGGVETEITDDLTESTFNLTVQQRCADFANADTGSVEAFVAADVYGGRI